jgi:hypothetical protein
VQQLRSFSHRSLLRDGDAFRNRSASYRSAQSVIGRLLTIRGYSCQDWLFRAQDHGGIGSDRLAGNRFKSSATQNLCQHNPSFHPGKLSSMHDLGPPPNGKKAYLGRARWNSEVHRFGSIVSDSGNTDRIDQKGFSQQSVCVSGS